jgi:hypothetical protein
MIAIASAWALFWMSWMSGPAHAHPLDLALLKLAPAESYSSDISNIQVTLEVNPGIAAKLAGAELKPDAVYAALLGEAALWIGGQPCAFAPEHSVMSIDSQNLRVAVIARCPLHEGELVFSLPFLRKQDPTYRMIYNSSLSAADDLGDATPARSEVRLRLDHASPGLGRFIALGMAHIGVLPGEWSGDTGLRLPLGMDHILFVLALVIGSGIAHSGAGRFFSLLKVVTGFTLGHTLSLAAAATGIVHLSGRWVEAAVALTIAYVSGASVIKKSSSERWTVAIGIGLIHGLGFAAAISGLNLRGFDLACAIVGFNVGVELGQGGVIALTLPLIFWLGRKSWGRNFVLKPAALCICVAASYWFVTRAGGGR